MIKPFFTIYLPATALLGIAAVAGVLLYQTQDVELNSAEFVEPVVEPVNTITVETTSTVDTTIDVEVNQPVDFVVTTVEDDVEPSVNLNVAEVTEATPAVVVETAVETVVTIAGPGISKRCAVQMTIAQTAHQLMKLAAEQCRFSYAWENYPSLGVFVTELGGVTSKKSKGKYWIFYVNGTKANVGVSSYQLQPGDLLAWKFEQEY